MAYKRFKHSLRFLIGGHPVPANMMLAFAVSVSILLFAGAPGTSATPISNFQEANETNILGLECSLVTGMRAVYFYVVSLYYMLGNCILWILDFLCMCSLSV